MLRLSIFEQALACYRRVHSADHPNTANAMLNIANCYVALGRHAETLDLNEQVFAGKT
jgi:hypothetical protein